ncbi:MAG: hypothetical protein EZS28_008491, partial [Streblomastix strix]
MTQKLTQTEPDIVEKFQLDRTNRTTVIVAYHVFGAQPFILETVSQAIWASQQTQIVHEHEM